MSFKYLGIVFYSPAVDLNPLQNSSVPAAAGSVQTSCYTCLTLIQECCNHFLLWETKELLNKSLISFMTFTGFTCSIELVPAGPQTSLNYYNIVSAPEPNVFIFMLLPETYEKQEVTSLIAVWKRCHLLLQVLIRSRCIVSLVKYSCLREETCNCGWNCKFKLQNHS